MNLTIFVICFNEQFILPFFIKWYRGRFPDCKIIVFDNMSTDDTVKIALENNCEVRQYDTGGKLSDSTYLEIKNNCWKYAKTDWVLIADADEFLDIKPEDLNTDQTLYKSKGYNMCNVEGLDNVLDIKHGIEAIQYDKVVCFNKLYIKEINYTPGCHSCDPKGDVIYTPKRPKLLHMKFLDENYIVERYKMFKNRMSEENIKMGWGIQYREEENIIRESFRNHLKIAKEII